MENKGPGCNDAVCQACVCAIDPPCCEDLWDLTCSQEAANPDNCSASCPTCPTPTPTLTPTPGGDCCSAHDGGRCDDATCSACVINIDPPCGISWDTFCVDDAVTPDPDGCRDECPCKGNCCVSQGNGKDGCEDDVCAMCVCDQVDASCCSDSWDETCVEHANEDLCGSVCGCGGLPGDCCLGNDPNSGIAGCLTQDCQDCVCGVDPYCCQDVWDDECAGRAADPDGCGAVCGCGQQQSCCYPHTSGGCDNGDCQACVLAVEPSCADLWDVVCVDRALTSCPDVCTCGPTPAEDCCVEHLVPGCEDDACDACVCDLDPFCCDNVWDLTCVSKAANAVECTGQCLCQPRPLDDCCVEEADAGCSNSDCQQCVCDNLHDEACCTDLWDRRCADEAAHECFASCGCQRPCVGDCLGLGFVSTSDLVTGINIVLDNLPLSSCGAFDFNGDGMVTIDELVSGIDAAVSGCR